ncbi:MAG: hypothetical protein AAB531_05520 [Patescibacteria group bacterium]
MQNSKLQFKIQNLIIWELIGNWKLPAPSKTEGKIGNSSERGYVAISIILILTAVLLGIIVTVAHLGIGEGQVSLALSKGEDTLTFVEGCVEDVMLKIRSNPSYNGTAIMHNGETCTITYNSGGSGPTNWDLTVSPPATDAYNRKIRVQFTRNPSQITLNSWKEI